MLETRTYKLSAGAYMRELFPLYLARKWWLFAVVVLPFAGLSFVNVNFIYVALMSVFLVVPTMLGFAYLYYAFGEECVASVRKSRVRIAEKGVTRIYMDADDNVSGECIYGWHEFDRMEVSGSCLKLFFRGRPLAFQMIPAFAFASPQQMEKAAELAGEHLSA